MKLINKAQPVKVNLSDKFKAGQTIAVTTKHRDGYGYYGVVRTYTINKVNRDTIDITAIHGGDTHRLDPDTVREIVING